MAVAAHSREAVMKHLHVITGGPGAGKTSLIAALAREGLHHMLEAGRAIIQEQVGIAGSALPWADREAFAARMLARDMDSYRKAASLSGPVVFDRGIPDVIGYLRLCGIPVPASIWQAAENYRYAEQVFIAPPWPAIFAQDAERKQSLREAEDTYQAMVEVYSDLEYKLVSLPLAMIEERAQFVLSRIS
ncbi:ATPase [Novosphingobium sp. TCA1]|nr:ATPase [Novosphingobium sp. TCA1]